jgi:two-component system chemotaxis response regulator CheB
MSAARGTVRVLVVDDSAFARKVLREALSSHADLEVVGTARDGLEALERVGELAPDVMTLDLAMPNLDGLGVLRALAGRPAPRVVVVTIAERDGAAGLAALDAGAIDLVHKPTALATDRLREIGGDLVRAVRAAARAAPRPTGSPPPTGTVAVPATATRRLVVVGASTGGPQAVTQVLRALPADFPVPLAVVVHLPPGYTRPFAERLDHVCPLRVSEAADGVVLAPGTVLVAKAGWHLRVVARDGLLVAALDHDPAESLHRPSVDVLFASAARATGAATLGVVLTGMGDDGLAGSRELHARGATIVTESEASCVVYGMPRAVAEAGLSAAEVPLSRMAAEIAARI